MNERRNLILFLCIIAMMASLFLSRALLSISMALFVLVSFWHGDFKGHLKNFISSPVLWSMSLLFLIPLISGIWSEDKKEWISVLRIKLPLLLLPLAFAGPINFPRRIWDILAYCFLALTTAGSIWSMFHYVPNIELVNESYLRAKSIATLLGNDHVRFSWLVSVAILLAGWMWLRDGIAGKANNSSSKTIRAICLLIALWLIIFLHILAARTGLFSFYIILLVTGAWLIVRKARRAYGMLVLLLLIALPFLSYLLFPSFQNRIKYISYDYSYFKDLRYLPGGNDVTRVISLRAGWNLLKENPVIGLGAGDIYHETHQWDRQKYPDILDRDMLYPSSEWLIYGLTCGWAGVLIFTAIMLVPFFSRRRPYLVWLLLNLVAAFSFLFDMGLEVQFGVFAYSFIVLWWWKWFKPQNE